MPADTNVDMTRLENDIVPGEVAKFAPAKYRTGTSVRDQIEVLERTAKDLADYISQLKRTLG